MNSCHWGRSAAVASMVVMIGSNAPAYATDSGAYLRVSAGVSNIAVDDFSNQAYLGLADEDDAQTESWSLAAGYRITRYVAIEASYLDFGEVKLSQPNDIEIFFSDQATTYTNDATVSMTGTSLAVVGMLPIDRWEFFVRLGALRAETETSQRFVSYIGISRAFRAEAIVRASEVTTELLGGMGVGYSFGEHFQVNLEWSHAPDVGVASVTGEGDADSLALALEYRF